VLCGERDPPPAANDAAGSTDADRLPCPVVCCAGAAPPVPAVVPSCARHRMLDALSTHRRCTGYDWHTASTTHTTNSIRLALATVLGSSRSNRIERYPSIGRQICSSSRYDRHSSCSWSAVESASSRTCVERPPSSISNRYEQPIPINYRSFSLSL